MKDEEEIAWAVELVVSGKRVLQLDLQRHSTPEQAKLAYEKATGIPWKEAERNGARVVRHLISKLSQ